MQIKKPFGAIIFLNFVLLLAMSLTTYIKYSNMLMQKNAAAESSEVSLEVGSVVVDENMQQMMVIDPIRVSNPIMEQIEEIEPAVSTPTPSPTPSPTPTPEPEPTPYYDISEEDYEILYRIVEAEATGGTFEQKANVASCIFARIESDEWPDTVEGVVFQSGQFSPLTDGRYYSVTVTDETIEAVDYIVMNGKEHDYIYFCSYGCSSSWFNSMEEQYRDGIHRYFYG